jgi:hypothetical protein
MKQLNSKWSKLVVYWYIIAILLLIGSIYASGASDAIYKSYNSRGINTLIPLIVKDLCFVQMIISIAILIITSISLWRYSLGVYLLIYLGKCILVMCVLAGVFVTVYLTRGNDELLATQSAFIYILNAWLVVIINAAIVYTMLRITYKSQKSGNDQNNANTGDNKTP